MLSSILESKFESSGVDILRHKSLRVSSGEINVGHTGFHPCGVLALVFISTGAPPPNLLSQMPWSEHYQLTGWLLITGFSKHSFSFWKQFQKLKKEK